MIAILKFEWNRMIHSASFRLSMLIACMLSLISSVQQFSYYCQGIDHISVFYRWIGQSNYTFGSYYLYQLMPLLAAFAYSHTLCSDRTRGYVYQAMTRSNRKAYFLAKYLISFAGGGLVFSCSVLFNFLVLSCFMPAIIPDPADMSSLINPFQFASTLFYTKPYFFMVLWLLVTFLWGGTAAVIGLTAGTFTNNVGLTIVFPILLFISESVIGTYIMYKNIFFMGYYSLQLIWTALLCSATGGAAPTSYILITIAVLLGITSFIYWFRVRKYEYV